MPYDAITAFPTSEDHHKEMTKESLNSENTKCRQQLYIEETELKELQMKFENLRMENNGKENTTSDDHWGRQYVLTKQMQKTDDNNLKQIKKVFAQKHLEISQSKIKQ